MAEKKTTQQGSRGAGMQKTAGARTKDAAATVAAKKVAAKAAKPAAKAVAAKPKAVARPATRAAAPRPQPRAAEPTREPRARIEATPLPTAPAGHAPVVGADGSSAGSVALPESLASAKKRTGVLFQAFTAARANARLGTAATKNRSRVAGGGAKPWRQKGTGRARQGSTRAPHWRHGGVVFGPNGRTYWQRIPERMRKAAFGEAFAARAAEGRVIVFDQIGGLSERPRSAEVYDWLARIGDTGRTLIVGAEANEGHGRAIANLADVELRSVVSLRLVDVLGAETVLVARPALELLAARADVAAVKKGVSA
ncbi:MAG TPA: 50S ribosomal protein L4 [Candidatus Limnocylindria bacterium]|nr:50S ribosomal protein L4 [Candidatus Limnocylindria bacterium]